MITLLLQTLLLICLHLTSVYFTVEKHVCSFPYFGAYSMVNTRLIVHSMDIQATLMSPGRTKHVCCFPNIGVGDYQGWVASLWNVLNYLYQ